MKKSVYKLLAIMFLLNILSCDKDIVIGPTIINYQSVPTYIEPGTQNNDGNYAITFGPYTRGTTRAIVGGGVSGNGYDEFKLYTWNEYENVMNPYIVKAYSNNAYYYVGAAEGQDTAYFNNVYDSYNFIGVITSTLSMQKNGNNVVVNNVSSFTVENEDATDTPDEFLYAKTIVTRSNYKNPVQLNFNHGNAKVYLKFISDRNDTKILDFKPGQSYHSYSMVGKPFPVQGPSLSTNIITDEDIEYINSRYTSSLGWVGYYSSNTTLTGDLETNMWDYLVSKHPELLSTNINNWSNYTGINHETMRLIHVDKSGADNSYRAWFINTINVQLIDNGIISDGINGAIILPASSVAGDGSDAVKTTFMKTADVMIPINSSAIYSQTSTVDRIVYTVPSQIGDFSPTTWYALPDINDGMTVKFSYTYNGVSVYDARVWISTELCNFIESKIYEFVIDIRGYGNGKSIDDADENDPVVNSNSGISLIVSINPYNQDKITQTYTIR